MSTFNGRHFVQRAAHKGGSISAVERYRQQVASLGEPAAATPAPTKVSQQGRSVEPREATGPPKDPEKEKEQQRARIRAELMKKL